MVWKILVRSLRVLGLIMTVTAALFGIPIVVDPPPRDLVVRIEEAAGRPRRKRRRRS